MTSCFVYKAMGLTFHDSIITQLIYRFELAQVVARKDNKTTTKKNLRFESHWLHFFFLISFFFFFFFFGGGGGGGGSDFIILYVSFFFFFFFFLFRMPLTCIRHIYKTFVTTQTTVNSEIYVNSIKRHICDVKIRD